MLSTEQKSILTAGACIFTTSGTLGFIANLVQMVLICRDKKQTSAVFGIILLSLSVSDLIVSSVLLYRGVVYLLTYLVTKDLDWFARLETPSNTAIFFSFSSSFFHIIFIAAIRVIALLFPLRVRQIVTRSKCLIILALVWLSSVGLLLFSHFVVGLLLAPYLKIWTLCSLVLAYSIICFAMRRRLAIQGNDQMQRNQQQSERSVLIYSMVLTFTFCLCTIPESLTYFIKHSLIMSYFSTILYSLNPLFDTLLYFFTRYCRQNKDGRALRNNEENQGQN